jgi:hypothetical protein
MWEVDQSNKANKAQRIRGELLAGSTGLNMAMPPVGANEK